jgi:hypothetical protein
MTLRTSALDVGSASFLLPVRNLANVTALGYQLKADLRPRDVFIVEGGPSFNHTLISGLAVTLRELFPANSIWYRAVNWESMESASHRLRSPFTGIVYAYTPEDRVFRSNFNQTMDLLGEAMSMIRGGGRHAIIEISGTPLLVPEWQREFAWRLPEMAALCDRLVINTDYWCATRTLPLGLAYLAAEFGRRPVPTPYSASVSLYGDGGNGVTNLAALGCVSLLVREKLDRILLSWPSGLPVQLQSFLQSLVRSAEVAPAEIPQIPIQETREGV